ncbi:MFS transporter [Solirubrobacter phytolaccae]|uniref:MFS transporter n=1 Tax=Solirubrobacter phytolaccae TaxID=1404360 RepID=A0A9X3SGQ6_9ACTN|nr:MFS transporter [Solirubrobacter phytolaccae]MDA0182672.1 MFS transporter [Solirubrobacter phytolaccae]
MTDRFALRPENRWFALVVLCVGFLMIVLDSTIVNVALPAIQTDLDLSSGGLAWVINAYLIAFGGLLLLAGRVGDLVGRRQVFLAGLALFTFASLLCGVATTSGQLIAARFVQGVGGALGSAVILGMIVTMFPKPAEQAKAIAVFSFVGSAGASIGLLMGGVLTQLLSWHWIFIVNVPIGIAAFLLARPLLAREPGLGLSAGADVPGAVLVTGALMLAVYTIVDAESWLLGGVAVVLLALFVARQATASKPLLRLGLLRNRDVVGANVVQMIAVAGMLGMSFLAVLYLQRVLGYDAFTTGVSFLPISIAIGVLSLGFSARLITRFGARLVLLPALAFMAAGLALLGQAGVDGQYWIDVLPALLLMGIGAGLVIPALMTLAMSGVTPEDAGFASGLVNTTQQVGGAFGIAILATVAANESGGATDPASLVAGYNAAFMIAAALAAAALVLAAVVLQRRGAGTETAVEAEPAVLVG